MSACRTCLNHHDKITRAGDDIRNLAKKLARDPDSTRLAGLLAQAQANLDTAQHTYELHLATCTTPAGTAEHTATCPCGTYTTKPQRRASTARQMLARHQEGRACPLSPNYVPAEQRHSEQTRKAHHKIATTATSIAPPGDWVTDAACAQVGGDLFYPEGKGTNQSNYTHARKICASCPVKAECLDYALSVPTQLDHGMWAGTTPAERATLRRKRTTAA